MNDKAYINPKIKYIYHSVSIIMMVMLIFLMIITKAMGYNTYEFIEGIFFGWILQYSVVNFVVFIDRKNLIN